MKNPITGARIKEFISFIIIVVPSLYFGYYHKTAEMGLAIITGAIAAAFINIDKFSRFKGAGFEAELRQVANDVYATIDTLKEVITPFLITNLNTLISDGYIGGMSPDTKYSILHKVNKLITSFKIEDTEIDETIVNLKRALVDGYYCKFVHSIRNFEFYQELYELKKTLPIFPSLGDIENTFTEYKRSINEISPESKELLDMYLLRKKELL